MRKIIVTLCALMVSSAASAGVVVIAHPSASGLTENQIAQIFLGADTSYTPVDQPESAAIRSEFYQKATGRSTAQVKATWARLTFSGKAQPPRELPNAASVKAAVAADPTVVGYIDSSAVDDSVKVVLTLD